MRPPRLVLRLYVAGVSPNSVAARTNLQNLSAALPEGCVRVEIIDVFEHPERALDDGVRVTPTLLKLSPRPRQMVVGDLSNVVTVRAALGLVESGM